MAQTDAAVYGLIGTFVGTIASVATTAVTNWLAIRKERESRRGQRQMEYEKWLREQMQTSITATTYSLNIYIPKRLRMSLTEAQDSAEIQVANAEISRSLIALLMHYPDKESPDYKALKENVFNGNFKAVIEPEFAWEIRQIIVRLAVEFQQHYKEDLRLPAHNAI